MKIIVLWKKIKILEVEKIEDRYFSKIIVDNYLKIKDEGFPLTLLNNIKVIDEKLPNIIKDRLPEIEDYNLDFKIAQYIKKTKCKRVTDYITLDIEE